MPYKFNVNILNFPDYVACSNFFLNVGVFSMILDLFTFVPPGSQRTLLVNPADANQWSLPKTRQWQGKKKKLAWANCCSIHGLTSYTSSPGVRYFPNFSDAFWSPTLHLYPNVVPLFSNYIHLVFIDLIGESFWVCLFYIFGSYRTYWPWSSRNYLLLDHFSHILV